MTLTLSSCYWDDKTLFLKYPEPWIDSNYWDKFNFYAWDYWPEVIHTEEARFLPTVWDKIEMLIWEWAYTSEIIAYYEHVYSESFCKKNITPYSWKWYYDIIREKEKKTLIVGHPYWLIEDDKYHINPDLIFSLNDKTNMSKLTNKIPKHTILSLNDISDITNFPFVLKAHSWASWDGVRIIYNNNDLKLALDYFKNETELMVEEFIEIKDNYNVQLIILQNWNIEMLWSSIQNVTTEWEYNGNYIYKSMILPKNIEKLALEICENAYKLWYNWICWLDIITNKSWDELLIDPNFRLNWSTSTLMLKEKVFWETCSNILKVSWFNSNHTDLKTMIKETLKLKDKIIYILSAYKNKTNWIIHWHCITHWTDEESLQRNLVNLETKWFKI